MKLTASRWKSGLKILIGDTIFARIHEAKLSLIYCKVPNCVYCLPLLACKNNTDRESYRVQLSGVRYE